jgi:hypothetical protein
MEDGVQWCRSIAREAEVSCELALHCPLLLHLRTAVYGNWTMQGITGYMAMLQVLIYEQTGTNSSSKLTEYAANHPRQ